MVVLKRKDRNSKPLLLCFCDLFLCTLWLSNLSQLILLLIVEVFYILEKYKRKGEGTSKDHLAYMNQ